MQQALLEHLRKITEEEQRILDGVAEVDKDLYTSVHLIPNLACMVVSVDYFPCG